MKQLFIAVAVASSTFLLAPLASYGQQPFDIGKREYTLACAACHGESGKGNGPVVEFLKKPASDLTTIQKNNSGVFPFQRLYEVIDGRTAVAAHGPREMTVWGREFREDAAEMSRGFDITARDAEAYVRGRIITLIGYIYTLQAK